MARLYNDDIYSADNTHYCSYCAYDQTFGRWARDGDCPYCSGTGVRLEYVEYYYYTPMTGKVLLWRRIVKDNSHAGLSK